MEQLAIKSFLSHGHPFHLYVFQRPEGIPEGTIVRDANEILPAKTIFKYRGYDSYAGFSDYFRFKLLLERGGWWVDADVICLKPFRFRSENVFASEMAAGRQHTATCVIKAPPGCPVMARAWQACQSFDTGGLEWGQAGPALLAECVEYCGLTASVQHPRVFCPIDPQDWESILAPRTSDELPADAHAIHLWRELWRRMSRDPNAHYSRRSLYEKLKRSHGVTSASGTPRWRLEAVRILDGLRKRIGKPMQRA
jgi:hypothetical protein